METALAKKGIKLLRSDVGDKKVLELMSSLNCVLGGEPSGHIIQKNLLPSGDGILTSLSIAKIILDKGAGLSELIDYQDYPQYVVDLPVKNKNTILNNVRISDFIENERTKLANNGRIIIRASGTEQVIRILTETKDKDLSERISKKIAEFIEGNG